MTRKITRTYSEAQVYRMLHDFASIIMNSGQYEIQIKATFSDDVPVPEDFKSLKHNIVELEVSDDGEDVYYVELAAAQTDDTWETDPEPGCYWLPEE